MTPEARDAATSRMSFNVASSPTMMPEIETRAICGVSVLVAPVPEMRQPAIPIASSSTAAVAQRQKDTRRVRRQRSTR